MARDLDMYRLREIFTGNDRFAVSTHVEPDGDAIGSALAVKEMLEALGKDVVVVHSDGTPAPYAFLGQEGWLRALPADIGERVLIAVDSASRERVAVDEDLEQAKLVVNIDHHRTNTRFGHLNVVRPEFAATCEFLCELVEELELAPSEALDAALYVGVHTDTGGLVFSNTSDRTRARIQWLAGRLGGAEEIVAKLNFRPDSWQRYSDMACARVYDAGAGVLATVMDADDLDACGVDPLEDKQAKDAALADLGAEKNRLFVFVYELANGRRYVSLRSNELDAGALARDFGGGGHPAAAGFTTELAGTEIVAQLAAAVERPELDPLELSRNGIPARTENTEIAL